MHLLAECGGGCRPGAPRPAGAREGRQVQPWVTPGLRRTPTSGTGASSRAANGPLPTAPTWMPKSFGGGTSPSPPPTPSGCSGTGHWATRSAVSKSSRSSTAPSTRWQGTATRAGRGRVGAEKHLAEFLEAGFARVGAFARVKLPAAVQNAPGREVLPSRFPYRRDSHGGDRYSRFRLRDEGQWLLHGHVHGAFLASGRGINVGVDVHDFAPVSALELARMIDLIEDESEPTIG